MKITIYYNFIFTSVERVSKLYSSTTAHAYLQF